MNNMLEIAGEVWGRGVSVRGYLSPYDQALLHMMGFVNIPERNAWGEVVAYRILAVGRLYD